MREAFSRWRTAVVLLILVAVSAMGSGRSANATSRMSSVGDLTVTPERAPPWVTDLTVLTNAYTTKISVTLNGIGASDLASGQTVEQMRHSAALAAPGAMGSDLRWSGARSYAFGATGLGSNVAFTSHTGVHTLNKGPMVGLERYVGMTDLG